MRNSRTIFITGLFLAVVLVASMFVAITLGPADIRVAEIWSTILHHLGLGDAVLSSTRDAIVWELRVPRVLTAAAVGAGLAVCGAIMQSVTRNPLADPYLLGLSAGASLGAVIVIVLGITIALPVAAFTGAVGALALTIILAGAFTTVSPSRTILAGVAVSALFGAITSLIIFWSATGDAYREILGWLLGSLAGATWQSVFVSGAAFLIVGLPLLLSSNTLDAFAFGDRTAASLGVNVTSARQLLLIGTALLTGALVSVSGSVGFVGLIVPHAVRLVSGPGHRSLLPLTALVGAILLVWADTGARTLFDPRELPVGIVTALVGAPIFGAVLGRRETT